MRVIQFAIALVLSPIAADAAIILTNASGANGVAIDSTRGFEFNTSVGFTVTHLAVYDEAGDGLVTSHEVGLWDTSGTLLVSAMVGSGTSAPLSEDGLWRLVDITDFVIPAASGYVVAASYSIESDFQFTNTPTGIGGVTYVQGRYINGLSGLNFPTTSLGYGLGGGGLAAIPVPEPAAAFLAAVGVLGLLRRRR